MRARLSGRWRMAVSPTSCSVRPDRLAMIVDDLAARIAANAARGLEPTVSETYANGVHRVTYRDAGGTRSDLARRRLEVVRQIGIEPLASCSAAPSGDRALA